MKRIIYHWTAGTYLPNMTDKAHYHFIVGKNGEIVDGFFQPEDNKNCFDNKYAKHTGGGNTSSVGIAFCGMHGFCDRFNVGEYPLTRKQCESGFLLGAKLLKKYNLDLTNPFVIQTHYGFGQRNPQTSSFGKIDIVYLPPYPYINKENIEKFILDKICWYFKKI